MSRRARPEVLAFLADVKENPDDPTPWLVLTDWLEENGDETDRARAEYCRLCLDRLQGRVTAADWQRGERRRELYHQYGAGWLGPQLKALSPQMRKGLVHITATMAQLDDAPPVHGRDDERWAWLGGLTVGSQTGRFFKPPFYPLLNLLCELQVSLGRAGVAVLARCPALSRLRILELYYHSEVEPLEELVNSPYLSPRLHLRVQAYTRRSYDAVRPLLEQRFARVDLP